MRLRLAALLSLLCVSALPAAGQEGPFLDLGVYRDTLAATATQPFVLRPFIRRGSEAIYVDAAQLDTTAYRIDYRFGRLWIHSLDTLSTVVALYETLGLSFKDRYRRVLARADADQPDSLAQAPTPSDAPTEPDAFALQRSGSITRGILAGNNRDAIIESGLRLQLAGEIAEDVRVQAVLTDESTPILPEGTTQRLNELDRVFIEISAPQGTAQLGDFDVSYRESEFAQFARKVQGIGLTATTPLGQAHGVGATARGIFQSQDVRITDGVQGPYRLEGQQNEQFIFVVPGSEAVFLDGARMTRGATQDYVIDYATGELTFTANRLMRDHYRVLVEFQYRTTEFTRTLLGSDVDVMLAKHKDGTARARLGATFLREADSRAFDQEFGLTAEDQAILEALGDSSVQRSGATLVSYNAEAPYAQYVRRDTLVAGMPVTIFAAVREAPLGDVYRVHFSRVGPGQGSYVREGRAINGIQYTWRGAGRGEYDPVRILPRPRQQRMLDLRGGFSPVQGLELFGEWAQSLYDRNRFSTLHGGDDVGASYTGGVRISPFSLGLGAVSAELTRRFTGQNFATFNRIRAVEFARAWNLDRRQAAGGRSTIQEGSEAIDEARLEWVFTDRTHARASVGRIQIAETFTGSRADFSFALGEQHLPQLSYRVESMRSEDQWLGEDGSWLRQRGSIELPVFGGRLAPNMLLKHNRRIQRNLVSDSLTAVSKAYIQYRPGLAWRAGRAEVGASVDVRAEDLWADGILRDASRAVTFESSFDLKPTNALRTEGRLGLRSRRYSDFFRTQRQFKDEHSAVVRWTGRWQPWRRAVMVNWFYEALSERTPTLQEIYIRTGPELGEYVWEDANGDGVIQIDEFLPEATQDEGDYARTLIPSDSLQSVTGLQTRFSVQLDPARRWRESQASWKRRLSNISSRTSVQIQEKSRSPNLAQIYLLRLGHFRSPEHTLKGLLVVQQDLFLFRNQPQYGLDASFRQVRSLNELAAGTETRFITAWRAEGRLKPSEPWALRIAVVIDQKKTDSESFASRTYDIRSRSLAPAATFSPTQVLQLSLGVDYAQKKARAATSHVWKAPLRAQYVLARRASVTGRLEFASVMIRGQERSVGLAQFELTDGRGDGTSFLWALTAWYQLSRVLRGTLSYSGRSPEGAPSVHTVRMQLGAVF